MKTKKDEITFLEIFINLKSAFNFLWKKKLLIAIIAILGGLTGLTISYLSPVKYKAELTFVIEESSSSSLGGLTGIASSFGISSFSIENGLYENSTNLISYFQSRSVIEKALTSVMPDTKETYAHVFSELIEWRDLPELEDINLNSPQSYTIKEDSILAEMYNYIFEKGILSVSVPNDEGSILKIQFISENQKFAKHFTERLVEIVTTNYLDTKTKLARTNVDILQTQVDSVRKVLNNALAETANESDQVFGLNPAFAIERVPATKKQIDIEMSSAVLKELIKNLELAKVRLMDQTPLIEIIDRPKLPLQEIKRSKISTSIKGMVLAITLTVLILLADRFFKKLQAATTQNDKN